MAKLKIILTFVKSDSCRVLLSDDSGAFNLELLRQHLKTCGASLDETPWPERKEGDEHDWVLAHDAPNREGIWLSMPHSVAVAAGVEHFTRWDELGK